MAATALCSADPPWHTKLLLLFLLALLLRSLPSLESLDEAANPRLLSQRVQFENTTGDFHPLISLRQLAFVRLLVGTLIVCDTVYAFLYASWDQDLDYYAGSKLRPVKAFRFRGAKLGQSFNIKRGLHVLSCFTMWVWMVEGVSFLTMGAVPLLLEDSGNTTHALSNGMSLEGGTAAPKWLCRLAFASWAVAAPSSLLVSVIVSYILWPMALRSTDNSHRNAVMYQHFGSLLEHNLNSVAVLLEAFFLSGPHLRIVDVPMAPLMGLCYVLFSYCMRHQWCDDAGRHGPQFLYPFLDPTLPGAQSSVALLGLLLTLVLSHGCLCALGHFLASTGGSSLATHLTAVAVGSFLVCRFR